MNQIVDFLNKPAFNSKKPASNSLQVLIDGYVRAYNNEWAHNAIFLSRNHIIQPIFFPNRHIFLCQK